MATQNHTCTSCGTVKPVGDFSGSHRQCNECRAEQSRDIQNTSLEGFLKARLRAMKQRHKQKKYSGALVNVEHLVALYREQGGICAVSGLPMHVTTEQSELSASPDRIDVHQGYVAGNIRLVCSRINLMRNSLGDHDFRWWCRAVVNNIEN